MGDFKISFQDLITYGSYVVSLTVAYYTLVTRIVRLETKSEQTDQNLTRIENSINEIKQDIKQLLKGQK